MENKPHKHSIGILKETMADERRVVLTPNCVRRLVNNGFKVFVEKNAGSGSDFNNYEYEVAGAEIVVGPFEVVKSADIIVKVKEPTQDELPLLAKMPGKTLFAFLHLADNPSLARELLKYDITAVSFDTMEDEAGKLPLLRPMSEIAGKFAVNLMAVLPAKIESVLVVGCGVTGEAAIRQALAMEIKDIVGYEKGLIRTRLLNAQFEDNPEVDIFTCPDRLALEVARVDLVVGAVLVKGDKCPIVVTEEMVDSMKKDARIVDVSIDQGGCVWGSLPTTHAYPTFKLRGKTYCCIPNMPGMWPEESTKVLSEAVMPYLLEMATRGPFQYLVQEPRLLAGLNCHAGKLTNAAVARGLKMEDQLVELG